MHVDGQHIWLSFFMNRVEPSHVLLQELLTRHCKFIWRDDVVMYLYIISKMLELKLKSTIKEYENEKIFQIIWRAERGLSKATKSYTYVWFKFSRDFFGRRSLAVLCFWIFLKCIIGLSGLWPPYFTLFISNLSWILFE